MSNNGKNWFDNLDGFGKDGGGDKSGRDKIKQELLKILPVIRQFRAQGGDLQIAFGAPMVWSMLASPDRNMLRDASNKLASVRKDQIDAAFNDMAAQADYAQALKAVEQNRKAMKDMPEASRIAFDAFLRDVIPGRLMKVLAMISDTDLSKSSAQDVREEFAKYAKTSNEDLARERAKHMETVPFSEMAAAVHETLQKASPDALATFLSTLSTSYSGNDLADLALTTLDLIEAAGAQIERGEELDFGKQTLTPAFQANLKNLLAAVDTALVAADLTPDTDIHAVYEANKRRQAASNNASGMFKPKGPKL
jgi:hypothetical protein